VLPPLGAVYPCESDFTTVATVKRVTVYDLPDDTL
jgi:hypothetical protein